MAQGKTFASVLLSVGASVLIMSLVTLFILPGIYTGINPSLNTENGQYDIQQCIYGSWSSYASITDSSTAKYYKVPQTELNITIKEHSKIAAFFNSYYCLRIEDLDASTNLAFTTALMVQNAGNRSITIKYYDTTSAVNIKELTSSLYIDYVTLPLTAGTYTVSVWWISLYNPFDLNSFHFSTNEDNHTRSLLVQEWKTST